MVITETAAGLRNGYEKVVFACGVVARCDSNNMPYSKWKITAFQARLKSGVMAEGIKMYENTYLVL